MGKFLVSALIATAVAMVAAQPPPHYRGGSSYRGFARDITDYGLFKLMSAIHGGGRGHRELLASAAEIRNSLFKPASAYSSYPTKNGMYLAPPPRGSKSYYFSPSGRGVNPADALKDTYVITGSPKAKNIFSTIHPASSSGPTEYRGPSSLGLGEYRSPSIVGGSEYRSQGPSPYTSAAGPPYSSSGPSPYSSSGPGPASSSPYSSSPSSSSEYTSTGPSGSSIYSSSPSGSSSEYSSPSGPSSIYSSPSAPPSLSDYDGLTASPSSPTPSNTVTVTSDTELSLEQIVAKAAQQQHQKVLEREQAANPGVQVTHQVRLAPQHQGGQVPQHLQQFIVHSPQGGQPGPRPQQIQQQVVYSPQQFSGPPPPGAGPQQQILFRGPPPQQFGGSGPQGQIIVQGPNGQPMILQYVPAGQQPQYIQGPPVQQIQQQQQGPPRGIQHYIPQQQQQGFQYQPIPQQNFQFGPPQQGQQIYTLPGPHGYFPQPQLAPVGLLGQPQFSLSQEQQQQIHTNQIFSQPPPQQQQGQQQQTSASEQNSSSQQIDSAESSVSVSTVDAPSSDSAAAASSSPLSGDSEQVTQAILHSQAEYSEPVHKI